MSEMIAQNRCPFWPWSKGATLWGEPLPYAVTQGSESFVMCGDWWNRERIPRLMSWQADAMRHLLAICGDDNYQRTRAVAQCHHERGVRLQREAGTKLNMRTLFASWQPSAEETTRIAELVVGYTKSREQLRSWLLEARSGHAELEEELSGEASTWSAVQMAAALIRLPRLLSALIVSGSIPSPGDLMPEKAIA